MALKLTIYTTAGQRYREALTVWLQDTRLMSEAIFRLYGDYNESGNIQFSQASWPKPNKGDELPDFAIKPIQLGVRMDGLLKELWSTRFVFLETLWEEYLQQLMTELRHKDAAIFEPFCERDFMVEIVREVLVDRLQSVDEVKDEVAARFAAGITRQSWEQQWKQLKRLEIGLTDKEASDKWFQNLCIYFEMRNCIIHRQSRVSPLLNRKTPYFKDQNIEVIEIWPPQLDFYRHQFISCLQCIEGKIKARYG